MKKKTIRNRLIYQICLLANLPKSKQTKDYFTRAQLIELKLLLENLIKGVITNDQIK
jgi:hypothetical protein